jgi:hypothetical protein
MRFHEKAVCQDRRGGRLVSGLDRKPLYATFASLPFALSVSHCGSVHDEVLHKGRCCHLHFDLCFRRSAHFSQSPERGIVCGRPRSGEGVPSVLTCFSILSGGVFVRQDGARTHHLTARTARNGRFLHAAIASGCTAAPLFRNASYTSPVLHR